MTLVGLTVSCDLLCTYRVRCLKPLYDIITFEACCCHLCVKISGTAGKSLLSGRKLDPAKPQQSHQEDGLGSGNDPGGVQRGFHGGSPLAS